ncbi:MAG: TAT-variant-translocated molybdopterin oxidoreductase [bacterium]
MSDNNKRKSAPLKGREYWRSLEQLADDPEVRDWLEREFPEGASELKNPLSRRHFLGLMGASLGLAGLAGCRKPVQKILPYVTAPETVVPGVPKYYATTMPLADRAYGVVVESHEGRPTKIEGNKLHPASLGGSNLYMQAAILGLYDPDRSQRVLHDNVEAKWTEFVEFWRGQAEKHAADGGAKLAVISESFASPTLYRLRQSFLQKFPSATWVAYEPVCDENIYAGTELATGNKRRPVYHFDQADIILSLDADFLQCDSDNVVNARGFAAGRDLKDEHDSMNRLYMVESIYSTTGAMADHRYRLKSSIIPEFAAAVALELQAQGVELPVVDSLTKYKDHCVDKKWLQVVTSDLIRAGSAALVLAGRRQPPEVHALVAAINEMLGAVGKTVDYLPLLDTAIPDRKAFADLVARLLAGEIETLMIVGGNPVYNAPVDLEFATALTHVDQVVHLSPLVDETSSKANWHLPQTHFLESWGDARSVEGALSIIQPLIEPLYGGHSDVELLALLATGEDLRGYDLVRESWREYLPALDYEKSWRRVLHDGLLKDSPVKSLAFELKPDQIASAWRATENGTSVDEGLTVEFYPSAKLFDGRFGNVGWLQELPDPITKVAWDNVALFSPDTAKRLGVAKEDLIEIVVEGRALQLPVWVLPGLADDIVALELGYGRGQAGRIADGVGANTYNLMTDGAWLGTAAASLTALGSTYPIANTQDHNSMEGRPLIREATLDEYRSDPEFVEKAETVEEGELKSLWNEHSYDQGYQWGMTIDLNTCTGCNACVLACQSENNVPIIGKEQVRNGREMHWLRMDRYFAGDSESPEIIQQPVACQHCENAPCEQVCPVAATVHDKEGLNVMVYNRCIGTRYCSNNCPYKVRRFNFFNYTGATPESLKMANNPDVTVRSRGVMEKCTYCVQRINRARQTAKHEEREIRDGDITTACQQACPVGAISFGNIRDQQSNVVKQKQSNRNYEMLKELNVKPRTSYLARIRNPHPELAKRESQG